MQTVNGFGDHFQHCQYAGGALRIARHNLIAHAVKACAEEAGCHVVWTEHSSNGTINDLTIHAAQTSWSVDVSVLHPNAPSVRHRHTQQLIADRERHKRAKHESAAIQRGQEFIPFVLDSYGVLGKSALTLIDQLGEHAEATYGIRPSHFKANMKTRISLALQRGNARITSGGIMQARAYCESREYRNRDARRAPIAPRPRTEPRRPRGGAQRQHQQPRVRHVSSTSSAPNANADAGDSDDEFTAMHAALAGPPNHRTVVQARNPSGSRATASHRGNARQQRGLANPLRQRRVTMTGTAPPARSS